MAQRMKDFGHAGRIGWRTWLRGYPAFGGDGGEATPVPIPNTAVKLSSADGTAGLPPWERRSPPNLPWALAPETEQVPFVLKWHRKLDIRATMCANRSALRVRNLSSVE